MNPIAIFRFSETEGPGYFATFLEAHSIPWQLIALDQGERVPENARQFSGVCLMGGPMSVNDPLPWINSVCTLIRDADARDIPVIGHCLGGQLISKALGGLVTGNPAKEIGWSHAQADNNASANQWFGRWLVDSGGLADVFQWHGETFSIPPEAQRILSNKTCINQMFTIRSHLAMQCHVEMTAEMIQEWCRSWPTEVLGLKTLPSTVQTPELMLAEAPVRIQTMRRLADQLYSMWIKGLKD